MKRHDCTGCDSAGVTLSEDHDEHGAHVVPVACEACCGLGELTECTECREPIALPEHEAGNGICGPCRADMEPGDASAEMARIRRVA